MSLDALRAAGKPHRLHRPRENSDRAMFDAG
jgi:hypothetical protein